MNTPTSTPGASPLTPPPSTSRAVPALQGFLWSVRRELWENHSIYVAPLVVAGVVLLGFLITAIHLARGSNLVWLDASHRHQAMLFPYDIVAGLIMAAAGIVSIFYCLEALHGERRDRSILFWKSLPVSDLTAVLAKASIPLLVIPLVAFTVTVLTQLCMLLLSSVLQLSAGGSAPTMWAHASLFRMSMLLLYHLFTVHSLWYAPFYAWFLLVSAWARRATFLWAFLPPLAIGVFEKIVFNTAHFASIVGYALSGGGDSSAVATPGTMPMDPGTQITLGRYLSDPGLWIALAVAAVFLAGAVQLRRYRGTL